MQTRDHSMLRWRAARYFNCVKRLLVSSSLKEREKKTTTHLMALSISLICNRYKETSSLDLHRQPFDVSPIGQAIIDVNMVDGFSTAHCTL